MAEIFHGPSTPLCHIESAKVEESWAWAFRYFQTVLHAAIVEAAP